MNPSLGNVDTLLAAVRFGADGLVAVTAQDAATGVVRMQAFANAQALAQTVRTGRATFWSRSRGELWEKGLTSGNGMPVQEVRIDCDGDAVLYVTNAQGPSCHTGTTSCFFRKLTPDGFIHDDGPADVPAAVISKVAAVIKSRRTQTADKSYVASLLAKGMPKILAKVAEEAGELAEALQHDDPAHTTHEAADLIFHVMVALEASNIAVTDVFDELARRFGTSGHVEKASRPATP